MSELLGAGGVIVGTLCYSAGSVMARPLMNSLAPAQMAAMTNLIGGAILLVASIIFEPGAIAALIHPWGWHATFAWLYLLLPGSILSTVIYFLLVRDWGASRTGTYAFVSPVIAVALGTTLFGERLDPADVVGHGVDARRRRDRAQADIAVKSIRRSARFVRRPRVRY